MVDEATIDAVSVALTGEQLDCLLALLAQSQPQGLATMRLIVVLANRLEAAEGQLEPAQRKRSKIRGPLLP